MGGRRWKHAHERTGQRTGGPRGSGPARQRETQHRPCPARCRSGPPALTEVEHPCACDGNRVQCSRSRSWSWGAERESTRGPHARFPHAAQWMPRRIVVNEVCWMSALDLAARYRAREISPVEVAEALLARIEHLNPRLRAFLTVTADHARHQARAAEARLARGEPLGVLDGVPYSLKDLEVTNGIRTTFGSKFFEQHVPAEDGVVAERLRQSGAVLLGKTNTPHFGYKELSDNLLGAPCRNPWNLARTSGGSSAGAAAAVAAGLGPLAHGTDGALARSASPLRSAASSGSSP